MSAIPSDLAELRRRIDEIDDRLHDLLIERAEIVDAGRGEQEGRRCRRSISRRARRRSCAGSPRAIAARCRSRTRGAHLARAAGGDGAARNAVRGRRLRAGRDAPGFWDLARDHYGSHDADDRLSLDRPGDPRRRRGPRRGRRAADAAGGRRRPVVARICCRRDGDAPRVIARLPFGAARQCPLRRRRRAGDRPRRAAGDRHRPHLVRHRDRGRHQPRAVSRPLSSARPCLHASSPPAEHARRRDSA